LVCGAFFLVLVDAFFGDDDFDFDDFDDLDFGTRADAIDIRA